MLNKVTLIGYLGAEPKIHHTDAGTTIASVSMATHQSWRDKATGDKKEHTEWHRVVFFNRLAEVVDAYLHKGMPIFIEGRLQTRQWQDAKGDDQYTTEVVANEMKMLGGKTQKDPSPSSSCVDASGPTTAQAQAIQFEKTEGRFKSIPQKKTRAPDNALDDDIPF